MSAMTLMSLRLLLLLLRPTGWDCPSLSWLLCSYLLHVGSGSVGFWFYSSVLTPYLHLASSEQWLSFSACATVGWFIWPVKIVPDMTDNVFGGTLTPTLLLRINLHLSSLLACVERATSDTFTAVCWWLKKHWVPVDVFSTGWRQEDIQTQKLCTNYHLWNVLSLDLSFSCLRMVGWWWLMESHGELELLERRLLNWCVWSGAHPERS